MSTLNVDKVDPSSGTALELGTSGDTINIPSGVTLDVSGTTTTVAITASGIIKTDDATEATTTTDGSLQTDGGLSVVKDAIFGDDVSLLSDGAILNFGANKDVSITHVADTGLKISSGQSSDKELLTLYSTQASVNGPSLKFVHDTASPADDDIAGQLDFWNDNDNDDLTQVGNIKVVMSDASDASEDSYMSFSLMDGGTFGEAARIDQNGNLLVGTASTGNGRVQSVNASTNSYRGYFANSTANFQNMRMYSDVGGTETETFRMENDGDVSNINNSYGALSDERIKQNITDANSQWEDIKALKVKNFKRKNHVNAGLDMTMIGVIAQDLETAGMGGLVKESLPGTGEIRANPVFGTITEINNLYKEGDNIPEGKNVGDVESTVRQENPSDETVKSVKYSVLYMKAIKCLQEAQTRIETLEAKVAVLEG